MKRLKRSLVLFILTVLALFFVNAVYLKFSKENKGQFWRSFEYGSGGSRDVLQSSSSHGRGVSKQITGESLAENLKLSPGGTVSADSSVKISMKAHACKPRDNVLFLKTHKTGSSTMINMLQRYGEKNNLTFVLPFHYNLLGWPWPFELKFALPPPKSGYNILCNHARYNHTTMKKTLPDDAVFVTILREPVQQFESAFRYMNMASYLRIANKTDPLRYFVSHADPMSIILKGARSHGTYLAWNSMAFDLGMQWQDFRDQKKILGKIQSLEKEFDLIMIAEYFEESLILLKEKLCWSLDDIVFFTMNQRPGKLKRRIQDPVLASNILKWNNVDAILYKYFNQTLWNTIKSKGPSFFKQVEELKARNLQMRSICLEEGYVRDKSVGWTEVKGFNLRASARTNPFCQRLVTSELKYTDMLRNKHKKIIHWVDPTRSPSSTRRAQTTKKSKHKN